MGPIDDYSRACQWPKVYLLSEFEQSHLNKVLQIDKIVHVYLLLAQPPDETVDVLHPIHEFLMLLEILLQNINQLLEILLRALKEDKIAVFREVVL
jgi:hypothetical protein